MKRRKRRYIALGGAGAFFALLGAFFLLRDQPTCGGVLFHAYSYQDKCYRLDSPSPNKIGYSLKAREIGEALEGSLYSVRNVPVEQAIALKYGGQYYRLDFLTDQTFSWEGSRYRIDPQGMAYPGKLLGKLGELEVYADTKPENKGGIALKIPGGISFPASPLDD